MAQERLSVHNIKEILRLRHECRLSIREIARSAGVRRSTASDYIRRAAAVGVPWPIPAELDSDAALVGRLFAREEREKVRGPAPPDWAVVQKELRGKYVTLALLWEEYRKEQPDGYSYTRYCELFREWTKTQRLSMRQIHHPGKKAFVDFSGGTIPVVDPRTGERREAKLFVAVLGYSNYTYAEPVFSEDIPTWVGVHTRAFDYFGGVPEIVVCDNLKSAVTRPCRYDPEINRTYEDFARHNGTAIIPAHVRKPKHKAKVEVGVQIAERWIIARLRKRTFTSLDELREAVADLVDELNTRVRRGVDRSRREIFESEERKCLRPLPERRYELAEFSRARVHIDYHIQVRPHRYSVHYTNVQAEVEVRATTTTVEIFRDGQRIASHVRSYRGGYTTLPEHMPPAHSAMGKWPPERIRSWAAQTGPNTAKLAEAIMRGKDHPEQGYQSCLGVISLARDYGAERVERASARAIALGSFTYRSLAAMLRSGLDKVDIRVGDTTAVLPLHENIRGSAYYENEN